MCRRKQIHCPPRRTGGAIALPKCVRRQVSCLQWNIRRGKSTGRWFSPSGCSLRSHTRENASPAIAPAARFWVAALDSKSQQLARSEIVVSCTIQASAEQNGLRNRYPLRVRSGGSKAMAKVIEFYVPDKFRRRSKWIPPKQRGKVIQFPALQKKSA